MAAEISFLRPLPSFALVEKRARPSRSCLEGTGASRHVAGAPPQIRHRDGVAGIPGARVRLARGARPRQGAGEGRPGKVGRGCCVRAARCCSSRQSRGLGGLSPAGGPKPSSPGGLERARGLRRGRAGLLLPYVGKGISDPVSPPLPGAPAAPADVGHPLPALRKPGRPAEQPPGDAASRSPLACRPPPRPAPRRGPTPGHGAAGRGRRAR